MSLVALLPFWIAAFAAAGLYQRRNLVSGLREYGYVLGSSGSAVIMIVVLTYLIQVVDLSRGFLLLAFGGVIFAFVPAASSSGESSTARQDDTGPSIAFWSSAQITRLWPSPDY